MMSLKLDRPFPDKNLEAAIDATENLKDAFKDHPDILTNFQKQEQYAQIRNEREKATFSMMMKMNPEALTNVRKEFFAREDSITLDEFIYIIQKHLVNRKGDDHFVMETPEQREFGINMFELFKDIDVNGDGQLEWQEYTSFTVEKANLLNKRARLASIAHYYDTSLTLDPSAQYRHRHDISRFVNLPSLGHFAMVEDHKNAIYVFNSRQCKLLATINTDAAPIAIESIAENEKEYIVTSGADMTLSTYSLDDPNPKRKYKVQSTWATPGVQMALAYAKDSGTANNSRQLLYSGATNGNIYSWDIHHRSLVNTLTGHADIVMNLIILQKLDNIASASLDKTLAVWDSHTNQEILRLYGHKKGVFDLCYNSDYRLIFSCGFEHDACVWSPFVKSLVFRLKGHHASLVVQTVQGEPEIITADTSGVFKLWDIRNFQCVQTFAANLSGNDTKDSSKLTCFFHTKMPSANALQKEPDSRIYAASKLLFSFDQARVVHEATSDYTNVCWLVWNSDKHVIITASEHNVIVWDALLGSRMFTHPNIVAEEISACCLDDRQRKIVIGDVTGQIGVYNYANGQLMKTVHKPEPSIVISLEYYDECKRFIAGYANGLMIIYDENVMEECNKIRIFEEFNRHSELLAMKFSAGNHTVATAGASSNVVRLWDYSSGKADLELHCGYSANCTVVHLQLLLPYPFVLTTDTTGNIIIWGSRGIKWAGLRIAGFLNQTPITAKYEPRGRHNEDEEEIPLRALPPPLPTTAGTGTGTATGAAESGGEELAAAGGGVGGGSSSPKMRGSMATTAASSSASTAGSGTSGNGPAPSMRIRGLRASFNPLSEAFQVDPYIQASSRLAARTLFEESEAKWGKVSAAQSVAWDPVEKCIYCGDDLGNLRSFDLKDVFEDMKAEALIMHTSASTSGHHGSRSQTPNYYEEGFSSAHSPSNQNKIGGLCRSKRRDVHSALPPEFDDDHADEFDFHATIYLLGNAGNAMSYLGVKFQWSLSAHNDRIIACSLIPGYGVLTAAADRLVKLWNYQGEPMGTLLQSVPIGTRSRNWGLVLNIDAIVEKENSELDEIVEQAQRVANDPNKPDITTLDFAGMQLGNESADFSRSALRQRIEKTAVLLGLDFPSDKVPMVDLLDRTHDDSTVNEEQSCSVLSSTSKSYLDALKEIKSTDSGVDYVLKTKKMSHIQQKRKQNKLESIARSFESKTEERTGTKIRISNRGERKAWEGDAAEVKEQEDLDKMLTSAEIMQGKDESSVNNDLYSLSTIKSKELREAAMVMNDQPMQSTNAAAQQGQPEQGGGGGSPANNRKGTTVPIQVPGELTVSIPAAISGTATTGGMVDGIAMSPISPPRTTSASSPHGHGHGHSHHQPATASHSHHGHQQQQSHPAKISSVGSKIKESIQRAHDRGPRTISMINSCRKYTAYSALDEAMKARPSHVSGLYGSSAAGGGGGGAGSGSILQHLPPEKILELRMERERKQQELLGDGGLLGQGGGSGVAGLVGGSGSGILPRSKRLETLIHPEKLLESRYVPAGALRTTSSASELLQQNSSNSGQASPYQLNSPSHLNNMHSMHGSSLHHMPSTLAALEEGSSIVSSSIEESGGESIVHQKRSSNNHHHDERLEGKGGGGGGGGESVSVVSGGAEDQHLPTAIANQQEGEKPATDEQQAAGKVVRRPRVVKDQLSPRGKVQLDQPLPSPQIRVRL